MKNLNLNQSQRYISDMQCLVILLINLFCLGSCNYSSPLDKVEYAYVDESNFDGPILSGAENADGYLATLENKRIGLVINQASLVNDQYLVDYLIKQDVDVVKLFAPEHGIRGVEDAGAKIDNGKDAETSLEVVSLFGKNKKPSHTDLDGIDIIVFDLQDVGVRFYTYISTLHYVMEAAAESGIAVMVLDRPNPNGYYVDGPVLRPEFKSFVGMHPVPVVYGMTIGEYAQMINGEGWLKGGVKAELTVIPCTNYSRYRKYDLPVRPSPNLPNTRSILLYPSLCFFEGTTISIGRGTDKQFQVIGHPESQMEDFSFIPVSRSGATRPKHQDIACKGKDLTHLSIDEIREPKSINLNYLIDMYEESKKLGFEFFNDNNFFEKLTGTTDLRNQIIAGKNAVEIRASWVKGINAFIMMRAPYLLYDRT